MARYIDADELIKFAQICSLRGNRFGNVVKIYVDACPTADVRPNVRGKWIKTENVGRFKDTLWKCSECGCEHVDDIFCISGDFNFCPNCGADMRGGQDDSI